jgi:hypothetical protein
VGTIPKTSVEREVCFTYLLYSTFHDRRRYGTTENSLLCCFHHSGSCRHSTPTSWVLAVCVEIADTVQQFIPRGLLLQLDVSSQHAIA